VCFLACVEWVLLQADSISASQLWVSRVLVIPGSMPTFDDRCFSNMGTVFVQHTDWEYKESWLVGKHLPLCRTCLGQHFRAVLIGCFKWLSPNLFFLPKCVAIYRLVTCFIGAWCCISFEARSLIHWWHTHCLTISLQKNHYILLYVGDTLVQFKRFFSLSLAM